MMLRRPIECTRIMTVFALRPSHPSAGRVYHPAALHVTRISSPKVDDARGPFDPGAASVRDHRTRHRFEAAPSPLVSTGKPEDLGVRDADDVQVAVKVKYLCIHPDLTLALRPASKVAVPSMRKPKGAGCGHVDRK